VKAVYAETVLDKTRIRTLPVLNRAVELAPAAQACCGACRTCVTTNLVGVAVAVIAGAGAYVTRLARRVRPVG
jgi:hypothetical protein